MTITAVAAEPAKNAVMMLTAGFAMLGITTDDLPNVFVLVLGAIIGTALAWARSSQDGHQLPRKWPLWQLTMCAFFASFVLFLQWLTGIDDGRPTGFVMGALCYLGREAVVAISTGALDQIKERLFKKPDNH